MRTQIIIKDTQVDLLQEVNLNITKQLVDINNPGQRKTDRTLTIDIPGSPANDKLFNYLFEVNIDLDADDGSQDVKHFNPNKKSPVVIYVDSIEQLRGYCQLTDVVVEQRDKISYKIVCYGVIGDLFAKIDNQLDTEGNPTKAELTNLDFSEYDHEYDYANVSNSWATSIVKNNVAVSFEAGKGYVYPMIDYGFGAPVAGTPAQWKTEYFRPAIYVKQYIDKIVEKAGFTYTSNFINSDYFKRLIIPFNSDKFIIDSDEAESRLMHVSLSGSTHTTTFFNFEWLKSSAAPILFNDEGDPFFDNPSSYNPSTGKFTCTKAGRYRFEAGLDARLKYNDPGKSITIASGTFLEVTCAIIRKRGSNYTSYTSQIAQAPFASAVINSGDISDYFQINALVHNIELDINDEVYVAAFSIRKGLTSASTGNLTQGWELLVSPTAQSYFTNGIADAAIYIGDTVSLNSVVPENIKQRDFLGSIIKAFNLYIEPNPEKNNDLLIEPRADFYTGEATDWTEKLDISKEFVIQPMAALDAGLYHFTYTDDDDYINKSYRQQYNRSYGDYKEKIDNDFVKNTKKIELIFAPTPSFKDVTSATTRVIPYIAFTDASNAIANKTSKIRLLYYGGMKNCDDWKLDTTIFTQYPYCGHLDDPYTPDFDLNFSPPFKIYYIAAANKPIKYTNQNLYTCYWYAQIKEQTDINSKVVEGWFYLTPNDICQLSFRRYYFIKDAYYRLLSVENYDPVFSKVTKCRFIKVLEFDAPLQARKTLNGGRGTFGTTDTVVYQQPVLPNNTVNNGNTRNPFATILTGAENFIAGNAATVLVAGRNNIVSAGAQRISVIGGGDNYIEPGLEDVTLINSTGVVVTQPGMVYIGNQPYHATVMGDALSIAETDSPFTLAAANRTLFCDATGGAITVNLPSVVGLNGKIFEIFKTDASANVVTVYTDGSETINGATSVALTAQYDKLVLVGDGTGWYRLG